MTELWCIDTQVLIWGLCEERGDNEKAPLAKEFVRNIRRFGISVMIPSIVLTELIVMRTSEYKARITHLIESAWDIGEFDVGASLHYTELWESRRADKTIEQLQAEGYRTNQLKFDALILAIAKSKGATALYSEDKDMFNMGDGFLPVKRMAEAPFFIDSLEVEAKEPPRAIEGNPVSAQLALGFSEEPEDDEEVDADETSETEPV